jgi:hypothetical protein
MRRRTRWLAAAPAASIVAWLVTDRFMKHLEDGVLEKGEFARLVDRIAAREVDPYSAAQSLLARALKSSLSQTPQNPQILRSSIP